MNIAKQNFLLIVAVFFPLIAGSAEINQSTELGYGKDKQTVRLDISASGKLTEYQFTSDEIGIVVDSGFKSSIKSLLSDKVDIKDVKNYDRGVYIVRLKSRIDRQKLFELAYSLEVEDPAINNAGVVIYPEKGSKPIIITNSIIIQFDAGTSDAEVAEHLNREEVELVGENPYTKGRQVLARVKPSQSRDAISVTDKVNSLPSVTFSHPDIVSIIDYRQFTPNDTLYVNQWHHNNTGASGGTADADGDTDFAWTITRGAAATTIAILDSGFDINHEDLTPNLWANGGEIAGNNIDDDGNGCIDDVNGCTFVSTSSCGAGGALTCGTGGITAANHGTSVAGVAAAQGNNTLGVSGACQNCTIIPIQQGSGSFNTGLSIGYAGAIGADVFSNSWGYSAGTPVPANVTTAINNTAATGTVIFWAMNNGNIDDCIGTADISANTNAIAISASSNQDRKVTESAFGNCMELLAPTHRGYGGGTPFSGTLNIATVDRTGSAGYNSASAGSLPPCPGESGDNNYTFCFGGTSSATPYTAGIAGLMLSAAPGLTRQQVQRSLQDTADKIQDSTGAYSTNTGFSAPVGAATHGFGRVNAFEAVRLVAPNAAGGRNNVDIFIRDNRLDWGNTEQLSNVLMEPTRGYIPHYQSVDIKIDAGPDFESSPPTTSAQFDAFVDEEPVSEELNRVYVRVHNRGATTAEEVTVKLQWAFAGTALPALPSDYWSAFPADSSLPSSAWNPLGTQSISNLQYSGASVAGVAADASQIVAFDFVGPEIDSTLDAFRHHCLLAVISSPQDPVLAASMSQFAPDIITPRDNNVTHKNVSVQNSLSRDGRFRAAFFVRNPFKRSIRTRLSLVAPKGWKVQLEGVNLGQVFELEADAEKQIIAEFFGPKPGAVGTVEIRQSVLTRGMDLTHVSEATEIDLGGVIYDFRDDLKKSKSKGSKKRKSKDEIDAEKKRTPVYKRGE